VTFVPVGGRKEVVKRVNTELTTLIEQHRVLPSSIAVITTRADLRDHILQSPPDALGLARWDDRDEETVVCETAHRLKGTEWEAVVLASLEPANVEWLPAVLYVAVSRATTWLSVVAPSDTGEMLGMG
jgi:superfamily I DNA/RNA helicase